MRISVDFKTKEFPQASSMMISSLVKKALENANKEYFKSLYFYENKKNKKTKNFTFSTYVRDYKLENNVFMVNDKITINISTPDFEFGINLYNGLLTIKEFKYKNFIITREKIRILKEKVITENKVILKTLSPIYVKDKSNNSLSPDTIEFKNGINYITDITLKSYRGYGLKETIEFTPVNMKKKVVRLDISDFKEKTGKPIMYLNTYNGSFQLSGDVEDLRDIYLLGIGFRRNEGFGMVEVL